MGRIDQMWHNGPSDRCVGLVRLEVIEEKFPEIAVKFVQSQHRENRSMQLLIVRLKTWEAIKK